MYWYSPNRLYAVPACVFIAQTFFSVFFIGGTSGGADGLDFDEKNNLLAAHYGSKTIDVFPPEGGSPVYRIPCPFDNPTNLHFKPHTNTLFVTEHDTNGVWTGKWKHNGKLHFRDL